MEKIVVYHAPKPNEHKAISVVDFVFFRRTDDPDYKNHGETYADPKEADQRYWFGSEQVARSRAVFWILEDNSTAKLILKCKIPSASAQDNNNNNNYHSVREEDIEIVEKIWLK